MWWVIFSFHSLRVHLASDLPELFTSFTDFLWQIFALSCGQNLADLSSYSDLSSRSGEVGEQEEG